MDEQGLSGIPEAWKTGAEEVRQHLVSLRGGALFLSPADALQLVQWFEQGVGVAAILCALERASEARRKRRSRIPLGLRQARRHLPKVAISRGGLLPAPGPDPGGPLGPLVSAIRSACEGDPHRDAMLRLADELGAIAPADPEDVVREALGAIRSFRDAVWEDTSEADRNKAREEALAELSDLVDGVDEATRAALVEEEAREAVRAGYAWLSAAAVWDAVEEVARR